MNPLNPPPQANDNRRDSISKLCDQLLESHQASNVSIGDLVKTLGSRGYGFILLVLDLPNLIPLPLPGLSTIFGIPMALIALQMIFREKHPWLPKMVLNRTIDQKNFERMVNKSRPYLQKLERVLRPRYVLMAYPFMRPLIGFSILVMAAVMALPIPFGNFVLAVPIALIALGLIERDGLFIGLGLAIGYMALALNLTIVMLGVEGVLAVFS